MVGVAALRGSRMAMSAPRQRVTASFRSARLMSSFRPSGVRMPVLQGQLASSLTKSNPWRPVPAMTSLGAIRFNSTSSDAPPSAAADSSAPTQASAPDDLSTIDITSIPEHIGYLKELGMDYGWGFTATMEWCTEHIHLTAGLPWASSIIVMGLITRAILAPLNRAASDQAAKMAGIKHIEEPVRQEYLALHKAKKLQEAQVKAGELRVLRAQHGIKTWKSLAPFLQIPLGFGMYRLTHGMASLPVPALADETFLWIQDLTVRDPYMMLPVVSAMSIWWSLKKGGENGTMEVMKSPAGKTIMNVIPAITFLFMNWQPAALQLYFATTALWAVTQSTVLNNHRCRRFLNMTPFPSMTVQTPPTPSSLDRLMAQVAEDNQRRKQYKSAMNQIPGSPEGKTSLLDRTLKKASDSIRDMSQRTENFVNQEPTTLKDGSPAPKPRRSASQLKSTQKKEEREFAEAKAERLRRNEERFQAHQRNLLAQKAAQKNGKTKGN